MTSNRLLLGFPVVLLMAGVMGCSANRNSIHREFNLEGGGFGEPQSQLIDVKQRSILVKKSESGSGGTMVCAEPSPDALSVYANAVAATVTKKSGASASFSGSSSEAGTAFGLRTQSIQLMRDAYYRACEAYISGAIDKQTYNILIRRLNNQAIAYLAIEQITSAATKATPAVISPPNIEQLYKQLDQAQKAEAEAANAKKTLEEEKKGISDADKQKAKQAEIDAAEKKRKESADSIEALRGQIAEAAKPILVPAVSSTQEGNSMAGAVQAAKEIALEIVQADYSPQMCFAYFQFRGKAEEKTDDKIQEYCDTVLRNFAEGFGVNERRLAQLVQIAKTHCVDKATPAQQAICVEATKGLAYSSELLKDNGVGGQPTTGSRRGGIMHNQ